MFHLIEYLIFESTGINKFACRFKDMHSYGIVHYYTQDKLTVLPVPAIALRDVRVRFHLGFLAGSVYFHGGIPFHT